MRTYAASAKLELVFANILALGVFQDELGGPAGTRDRLTAALGINQLEVKFDSVAGLDTSSRSHQLNSGGGRCGKRNQLATNVNGYESYGRDSGKGKSGMSVHIIAPCNNELKTRSALLI